MKTSNEQARRPFNLTEALRAHFEAKAATASAKAQNDSGAPKQ